MYIYFHVYFYIFYELNDLKTCLVSIVACADVTKGAQQIEL